MIPLNEMYLKAVVEELAGHSDKGTLEAKTHIVLHITDGPSARSAINTFKASIAPNRKSAHFVIDRSPALVYQLLPISDKAWHATEANSYSIGIEHAATLAMKLTEDQIEQSAQLVIWLCKTLNIPINRARVQTHFEASATARKQNHMCMPSPWADYIVTRARLGCLTVAANPQTVQKLEKET